MADLSESERSQATESEPARLDAESVARMIATRGRRLRRGMVPWTWNLIAGGSVLWILAYYPATWTDGAFEGPFLLLWTAFACLTARTLNRQARELSYAAVARASPELDRTAMGGLIEALEWPNKGVQAVARLRLAELLPTLTGEESCPLTPEQRTSLYDSLTVRTALAHREFVIAVLSALPALGDAAAVPHVERLATMPGLARALRDVREAARACLPRLEKRLLELRSGAVPVARTRESVEPRIATESAPGPTPVPAHVDETLKRIGAELGSAPQMRLPFLIASWIAIVPFCLFWALMLARSGHWAGAIPLAFVGAATTQLHRLTLTARHRRIARELSELDDVNAVGRLAEAIQWPEPAVRAGAISALTRLLPRLRASQANLLNTTQRACLYGTLTRQMARAHPEFMVALLKALEQIGDPAAIAPVRQLANGSYRSARQNRVKEAATDCIPFLQVAAQRNQASQILLRPASSPLPNEEILLRPAAGIDEGRPDVLLRPSSCPESATDDGQTPASRVERISAR